MAERRPEVPFQQACVTVCCAALDARAGSIAEPAVEIFVDGHSRRFNEHAHI
jgi:hypothetical protein